MKRRTLLLALGGGSAIGTGAVSQFSADRGVTVAASADNNALLRITPVSSNVFVNTANDTIELAINEISETGGKGINEDAKTALDSIVRLENQGSSKQTIRFSEFTSDVNGTGLSAKFYTGDASAADGNITNDITLVDSGRNPFELAVNPPGNEQELGLLIDATGVDVDAPDGVTVSFQTTITTEEN